MKNQTHQCQGENRRALRKEKAKSKSEYSEGVNKLAKRNKKRKNANLFYFINANVNLFL